MRDLCCAEATICPEEASSHQLHGTADGVSAARANWSPYLQAARDTVQEQSIAMLFFLRTKEAR
jgi:hypothetical protein